MAKKQVYSFVEKKYSGNSVMAMGLSLCSVIVLLVLLLVSFFLKGQVGAWIGAVGFLGIASAVCGLAYGFASFKDDCKSYFLARFGTILSAVDIAGWFFIVCIGLASA